MKRIFGALCLVAAIAIQSPFATQAAEKKAEEASGVPTLVITNRSLPASPRSSGAGPVMLNNDTGDNIVAPVSVVAPKFENEQLNESMDDYFSEVETATSRRIGQLRDEYQNLQESLNDLATRIKTMQREGRLRGAEYYASVAEIQTQLQAGSPPGNPRLIAKLKTAQDQLESMSNSLSEYNTMAVKIGDVSSLASYLMQSVQATYGLSGAIKEDHDRLALLEDSISSMTVVIERLLNTISEEITRASGYLSAERRNVRTLALAVANGDVYGANISNRLYSQSNQNFFPVSDNPLDIGTAGSLESLTTASVGARPLSPSEPQPLMVVRFDKTDVNYEQALYTAVGEAIDKYPAAKFEIVAVDPGSGNAAKRAIEAAKAKRNAERVLRSMVQMGVNANDVILSNASREDARTSEVHVLLR